MPDTYIQEAMCAKTTVRVITINGYQMYGKIFADNDNYIVLLSDGVKKLVFKHAVSTIEPAKSVK